MSKMRLQIEVNLEGNHTYLDIGKAIKTSLRLHHDAVCIGERAMADDSGVVVLNGEVAGLWKMVGNSPEAIQKRILAEDGPYA